MSDRPIGYYEKAWRENPSAYPGLEDMIAADPDVDMMDETDSRQAEADSFWAAVEAQLPEDLRNNMHGVCSWISPRGAICFSRKGTDWTTPADFKFEPGTPVEEVVAWLCVWL